MINNTRKYILERSEEVQTRKDYREITKKEPLVKRILSKIKSAVHNITINDIFAALAALAIIILILKAIKEQFEQEKQWSEYRDKSRKDDEKAQKDREEYFRKRKENFSKKSKEREWTQQNKSKRDREERAKEKRDKEERSKYHQKERTYTPPSRPSSVDVDRAMVKIEKFYYSILSELAKEFDVSDVMLNKVARVYWKVNKDDIRGRLAHSANTEMFKKDINIQKENIIYILKTKLKQK